MRDLDRHPVGSRSRTTYLFFKKKTKTKLNLWTTKVFSAKHEVRHSEASPRAKRSSGGMRKSVWQHGGQDCVARGNLRHMECTQDKRLICWKTRLNWKKVSKGEKRCCLLNGGLLETGGKRQDTERAAKIEQQREKMWQKYLCEPHVQPEPFMKWRKYLYSTLERCSCRGVTQSVFTKFR